ncbi:MAG: Ig-like domain repeat protein [Terracidiphilus sp.]
MRTIVRRPLLVFFSPFLLAYSLSLPVPTGAQGVPHSSIQPRITGPIDESSLVTLRGNTHPFAQPRFDLGPAPASMLASRMLLVLTRSTQQEADLQTYLQSMQDANSPNYRKFLSPREFGARFGVGDADLQSIQTWLTSHGFTVNKVSTGQMAIEFSGTVGQVQSTFHTTLHSYLIGGVQHWANASDPEIPTALSPVVAGLASLSSFRPRAHYVLGPSGRYDAQTHTITPAYTTGDATNGYYVYLGPADAATIYDTPTTLNATPPGTTYNGTGVTIGVAGDSNIDVSQNAKYRSTFGLAANPTTVVVDGNDPGENGDAVEAYLDTEVAGGIAPNANVILYTAADTYFDSGLFLAILRALDDNQVDILNVSFGACEAAQGTSGNQYIQNLWEQAAAQGISVTVSSGDSGSAGCDNPDTETKASQGLAVNGLGSTPYNIAVGGTDYDILYSNFPTSFTAYVDVSNTLANHRSALSYIPEEPWNDSTAVNTDIAGNEPISVLTGNSDNDNIAAGGGGISSVYPVPSWQSASATGTGRNLPDVSFLAGNGFYGALWGLCTDMDEDSSGNPITDCAAGATGNNFNLTGVGGTSAAAPAFAGMLALVKQKTGSRLGQADYVLYDLAKTKYSTVFHDVTVGDNSVNCYTNNGGCALNLAGYYFMTGYNAATGYDMASGLGSVNASQMVSNWAGPTFAATSSSLQLNGATTALSITHGQSVAVTASVTASSGTPTGDIALVDSISPALLPNNEAITDFTLSGGTVSGATNALVGGSYKVSAHYGGSSTDAQSDSNAIPVTVAPETSTTSIQVTAYDPATGKPSTTPYYGFIYSMDAQPYGNSASAANPNGAATGTITFMNGTTTLGTAALASRGIAELQTVALPGGNDSLTAVFPGDASFQASTSAPYPITVVPAVTTLVAQLSYTSYPWPIQVYLSTDSVGVAPTGTVTLMNGSTAVVSAPLVGAAATSTADASGAVTFPTTSIAPGTYNFTAVYSGDSNYAGSTAPSTVSVTVSPVKTLVVVTPSVTAMLANQPLQVTVTPTPVNGLPLPTGTVTMSADAENGQATTLTMSLVNGTTTFNYPANYLALGSDLFYASYSGDTDYAPNSGSAAVTVNSSGTIKPTVTVTGPTATTTYPFSITVTVSGPSGDPVPTGSVTVTAGNAGSSYTYVEPLTNGSVTFSTLGQSPGGPNTITAVYLGDSNYTSGSGATTVNLFEWPTYTFTLSSSTIVVDQPLSVTVALSGYGNFPTPTGTITLSSGTTYTSSPAQLTAGSVSFTIPANSLAVGSNDLVATYSGDSNYYAGTYSNYINVTAVPPTFTLAGTAVTVAPGASSGNTSTITLTPAGGFTGSVALTAAVTASPTGAVDAPTLSFGATTPVSITGTNAETATLTVNTTAATTSLNQTRKLFWPSAGGAALALVLLLGVPARRRKWQTMLGMVLLLVALVGGILACGGAGSGGGGGGGGNPGTSAGTYTITVTGTSGTTTQTGTVTLTVQ